MVDRNSSDDANENSLVVSDQEKGSRNKRKFLSVETPTDSPVLSLTEFPRYELLEEKMKSTLNEIEPLEGGCPQSNEKQGVESSPDPDWEDPIISQLEELLSQNLFATFRSAVKRIVECGYSEEIAERVILRSGLYHGEKDSISNIVDGALALLRREKVFDTARHLAFPDLPSLVEYTLLEMICVVREVKPALTVAETMWCLLIWDLNLVHACSVEGDLLAELCSPGSSQPKTEASKNTQSNPDEKPQLPKPSIPIAQTSHSKVPVASEAPQESNSKISHAHQAAKGKGSPVPLPEAVAKAALIEDKSGAGRKGLNKKDLLRRKTYQSEKNCKGRMGKTIKANLSAWGNMVLDKKMNSPSGSSGATKKSSHSKGKKASVKSNSPLAEASSIAPATDTSSMPPMQHEVNKKDPALLALEPESSIEAPDSTTSSPTVPDYYAGIPYDESLGIYVPQNERDEAIMLLIPQMKTLQKELQQWSDWAMEKVMQATRRLGKDQSELKMLRQEKDDAERFQRERQMLEESTMKRLAEMEQALVNTNASIEYANSTLHKLGGENGVLKKEMEASKLSNEVSTITLHKALAKEQETVKKCQAGEVEKRSLQEEFSILKQEIADLEQLQEKAKQRLDQFEVLWKQEEKVKQRILEQADSLKAEREQLRVQGKLEVNNLREKAERNMQKCKEDIQKLESEISQLRLQSERSKIDALKRGTPQMTKGLAGDEETSSSSAVVKMERECVMCMSEQRSVVFLPCAHQVLCANCNVLHEKKGMDDCPSCRTPIKKRITVCFADS
ncbi:putative E3 ubiquitin-protein ligase RF298 [Lycium ferocissimum]|uniref:putative E3 ubiquitin-protein ligase RF298 n=1 Tax=Lycium ferocissimum TaxID=112874 RepID=UPI002814F707|nr:putative E3 ubiquitin-protein ligase RF298 [Lycium ferocissimum]XP_059295615.1 putative E3 ubiquitin-protein ligase RF298 [Lycium ferocissimum]XP_059295619.1 putative E3 ubiquitin-protein ligase RF298 [Lycium ferocissimum]